MASCALDHSSLPNNVHVNHCDMVRLTSWVVSVIALCGFGYYDTYYSFSCFIIVTGLFIIHDKIMVLIGT
jgi:hypothetical protein